jgi:hypothetical protein
MLEKLSCRCFVLAWLPKSENVLPDFSMLPKFQVSVGIFQNFKFCAEFTEFSCIFWLVGLGPGLGPNNKIFQI